MTTNGRNLRLEQKALLAAVVSLWVYLIFFTTHDAPNYLPRLTGCYASVGDNPPIALTVDAQGTIRSRNLEVNAKAYKDKAGISLLPARYVEYDKSTHQIVADQKSQGLLRFDSNLRSFTIPDLNDNQITMSRLDARDCKAAGL